MAVTIERDLIISLLKLTNNGAVTHEAVKVEAKVPLSVCKKLLRKLQRENLLYLNGDMVDIDASSRLKLAVKAAELGADVERLSDCLSWQEFEGIAAIALERNGYVVAKNVRFKHDGKRWEIDVVGCRNPFVVCIDCKHWHHGMHPSTLGKMAAAQIRRVEAFADTLPNAALNIECRKWSKATLFPIILSLIPVASKFYDIVPVVPVFQLQDFINQLPAYVDSLKHFSVQFSHL
jgi:Holliday junction resolvase-like predicted endonuclease